MDAYDLITRISALISQGEIANDQYSFVEARRLLNNDLRQAIEEIQDANNSHDDGVSVRRAVAEGTAKSS